MKSPKWRLFRSLIPVLFGLFIVGIATWNYAKPLDPFPIFSGLKYKMGVDLAGGTILVYEIDPTKKKKEGYSDEKMVSLLKRRLDPADLYNITIRPLSKGRFEIILPTGGRHRAQAENEAWNDLIAKVKQKWPEQLKDTKLTAEKGDLTTLASEIRSKVVGVSPDDINAFLQAEYTGAQDRELTGEEVEKIKNLIHRVGSLEFRILANTTDDKSAIEAMKYYFNEAAKSWSTFLEKFKTQWKAKIPEGQTVDDIEPGNTEELVNRVIEWADKDKKIETEQKIREFLAKEYSPSEQLRELRDRALKGLPPPAPVGDNEGLFDVTLHGQDYPVTYSWVEIGKNMLHEPLRLNNEARPGEEDKEAQPSSNLWLKAQEARSKGELVEVSSPFPMNGTLLYSRKIPNPERVPKKDRDLGKKYEYFMLARNTEKGQEITGEYLASASDGFDDNGRITVDFRFDNEGGNRFYELTRKNRPDEGGFKRHLAVILDDMIMSAPTLNSAIRDRGQISGIDSREEVNALVQILRAGALPATLKRQPVSESTMGAMLGDDTIRKGRNAILFAFLFVLAFMVYYYRFAGLVACVALLANLVLTIAFMLIVSATFTLPGLAGLVLMLAMAVDANILIYERIREERDRGAALGLAIRNGYDRAFPTIIDTHLSSIFTAVVLYVVGNDQLKGFGISLTVGLIISLFTALYLTRVIFDFWMHKGWLHKLSMTRWLQKPNINFMRIRHYWFTATVILTIFGISVFLMRGEKGLNMDFVGGTVYTGELKEKFLSVKEVRDLVDNKERQAQMLKLRDQNPVEERPNNTFVIHYSTGEPVIVRLPNKATPQEVEKRASNLPDVSVELIFHSSPELTQGNKSRLFTVRTTEKSNELARAMINRLLVDDNGKTLQREPTLETWSVNQAILSFAKPGKKKDEVRPLVAEKLGKDVKFELNEMGREEKGGTYRTMRLTILSSLSGANLTKALNGLAEANAIQGYAYDKLFLTLTDETYAAQVQALLREEMRRLKVTVKSPDEDEEDQEQQLLGETEDLIVKPTPGSEEKDGKYKSLEVILPGSKDGPKVAESVAELDDRLTSFPLPVHMETFDSQLAADTQLRALYAILASWIAILLYLWFRFGNWTFGLAAVLCLIHDLCFTLGLIGFSHYLHGSFIGNMLGLGDFKIDLPTVAALLTLVGFSVNDTIVVFDRIREVRGKNPNLTPEMINTSINQTLSRTILTSLIAFLVVLVLYVAGGNGIHLFAFVMVAGVIIGTYSSVFVACPLLLIFGEGRQGTVAAESSMTRPPAETEA